LNPPGVLPDVPSGALDPADPRPPCQASLRAWLDLQRALALRPVQAAELLARLHDPTRARQESGLPAASPQALEADVAALRRAGALAVPLGGAAYPPRLAALSDPPPLLLVRGEVAAVGAPGVAVVGSRAATAYGLAVARRLGRDLAAAGLVVISGLARGTDAAAHEGALEAGGRSVAFLACGPDRVYPPEHADLARRIAARGAVATEHPPGTAPLPSYFPLRNRLLAGAALALVVVEARERSGSLTTARHAANQDLDVFAVPGPVDAPTSEGPNRLLSEGAFVCRGALDVLALLSQRGSWRPRRIRRRRRRRADDASELVRALRHAPATRDELARRLGRRPEHLALELLELELSGRVVEDRDGRLRVREV
jgi:DNA processing protein